MNKGALILPEKHWPAILDTQGEHARKSFLEFFTAHIRNANTREAYFRAVSRFFAWCQQHGLELGDVEPIHVASYVEILSDTYAAPSVKQHLAAIRMLSDWLVTRQVMKFNPAAPVRGPRHVVKRGKTPVLTAAEAKELIESIETSTTAGLRDRAFIGVMLYSFARVGAVCGMRVGDYYAEGKRYFLRLHEKGGKFHTVPVHHMAEEYLDAYIEAAGIADDEKGPLFRPIRGRSDQLQRSHFDRTNVFRMIGRRARKSGLDSKICCHSFRATGITVFMENGGSLETAAEIAAHESPRTTKLYDRTSDALSLDEIERIRL